MFWIFTSSIVFWQFFDDFFCSFGSVKIGNIWGATVYLLEFSKKKLWHFWNSEKKLE